MVFRQTGATMPPGQCVLALAAAGGVAVTAAWQLICTVHLADAAREARMAQKITVARRRS
jgi:hypothetical protein